MKFHLVTTDENYDVLKLRSTGGNWEIGLWRVMFGQRVRIGRANSGYCNVDFCAGADPVWQMEILNAVHIILLEVDEEISDNAIEALFPQQTVKPMINDPICWLRLCERRDEAKKRLGLTSDYIPFEPPKQN